MRQNKYIFAFLSILAFSVILINVNFLIDQFINYRVDITENHLYTLSPGTVNTLEHLKHPVTVRFYCSEKENRMPVALRTYASRIKNLLHEYVESADGNLILEKYDPEPDSDAEVSAIVDGIQPNTLPTGEKCYFGLTISYLDKNSTIAFLSPANEKTIEYDITRSIYDVTQNSKPIIGILSSMPVMGGITGFIPSKYNKKPPWIFVQELEKEFKVKNINYDTDKITGDIALLIIVHPVNLSEQTALAIDQYLLNGGKLLIFVDPYCFAQSNISEQNILSKPVPPGASDLKTLFAAWGVKFSPASQVLISPDNAYNPANNPLGAEHPAILNFTKLYFNSDNIIMAGLNKINMVFAGAFTTSSKPGITKTVLLKSAKYNELFSNFSFYVPVENIMMDFKSLNMPSDLIIQLSGFFNTAFPSGLKTEKPNNPKEKLLKVSTKPGSVILVSDADMLFNPFMVAKQQIDNKTIIAPINNNLDFILNAVDQLSGDSNILNIRSRTRTEYKFEKFEKIFTNARKKYHKKISELQKKLQTAENDIKSLETNNNQALSTEKIETIQKFRKEAKKTREELKQLRLHLRQNINSIKTWLEILNILLIPFLLCFFGIIIGTIRKIKHNKQRRLKFENYTQGC